MAHAAAARSRRLSLVSRGGGGGGGGVAWRREWCGVGSGLAFTTAGRGCAGAGAKSDADADADVVDNINALDSDRFYRRPDEASSPRADDELFWDPADLEDEDPPLVLVEDDELDEDDEDDDSWFFVPEGAGVNVKEEDLFVVGEDYDDDSFGFVPGFVEEKGDGDGDDDDDEYGEYGAAAAARGGKSNRRKLRVDKSEREAKWGGKAGGERAELSPKQVKAAAKKAGGPPSFHTRFRST